MHSELLTLRDRSSFLTRLTEEDVERLAASLREERRPAGELLVRAGEAGDCLYLVLEGRLAVAGASPAEARGPGDLVGAVAFAAGGTHDADVRCVEDCRLGALTRDGLQELLREGRGVWNELHDLALARMRRSELVGHLDRLFGPFGELLPYVVRDLERELVWKTLDSGDVLYPKGEAADGVYILLAGRLLVADEEEDGSRHIVDTVLSGETVGEVALLTERDRSQTVFAARDSELVRISPAGFRLLLERSSRALIRVSRELVHRLTHRRAEHDPGRAPIRCLGLLPADAAVPFEPLCRKLEEELGRHGTVLRLSSEIVDRELGVPGISRTAETGPAALRLVQWLHEQEARHRYLILQADAEWTPWSQRCARQADRVAVVADATADPSSIAPFVVRLAVSRGRWSLVLLQLPELARPLGTARWFRESHVESVLHVRPERASELERLARILTGRALGLVLGGGGARGFAHLGVFRALEELGVPVDMVGGASIGAPIGQVIAQGMSAAEAEDAVDRSFRSLLDYTLPIASILSGRRITDMIGHHATAWDIEDLWIPFFCVSTSLTTSRTVVHRHGSLARAVRASVSIPGVLPPVPENGELLVDGGVLNNLPIDVMRELNPFGTVIAIDVIGPNGPRAKSDFGLSMSGWRLAMDNLLPWRKSVRVPTLTGTVLRSMLVGAGRHRETLLNEGAADLYLNIHARGIGMLQFDKVRPVAKIGYEQSLEPLREWAKNRAN